MASKGHFVNLPPAGIFHLLKRWFAPRQQRGTKLGNCIPSSLSQLCLVWYAVWYKITSLSFTRVSGHGWTLHGIWSFLRPCLQASSRAGSLSRGLKMARLYMPNVSCRVILRLVSFNKRQQNEEAFFQKYSWHAHVSPMFPSLPYHGKHCFHRQFFQDGNHALRYTRQGIF